MEYFDGPDDEVSAAQLERIVDANDERRQRFEEEYDPLLGIGSYGKREELQIAAEGRPVLVPEEVAATPEADRVRQAGSLEHVQEAFNLTDKEHARFVQHFMRLRARYDVEFWFAAGCTIKPKKERKQRFILNYPQRQFLPYLLDPFFAGDPVRVQLVKARQWGGSTLTQLFGAYVQCMVRREWNLSIVADVQSQARHIRGMYSTLAKEYPQKLFGPLTLRGYEGMTSVKVNHERDGLIGVASVKNPDAVRSYTYHVLHLSEVGLWGSTAVQSAEDLAQGLEGGLVDGKHTVCVRESTAKGAGNYFHREWQAIQRGKSAYEGFFLPWFEIDEYQQPVEAVGSFVRSLTSYERQLFELGATLEGIAWYRRKKASMPSFEADWRMKAEFPATAEEAFQSTGRRVFKPSYVQNARRSIKIPEQRGYLTAASQKGDGALDRVELEEDDRGDIRIWTPPHDTLGGLLDLVTHYVLHRYAAFMDIGARHSQGDYHVVTIIDRARMLFGDVPEVAARYRGHMDQDLAAWYAAQLCTLYGNALLAVEINSLNRKKSEGHEPDSTHGMTVLDQIKDHYDNLFFEVKTDDRDDQKYRRYGFHTNKKTKPIIVDRLNGALRDREYLERGDIACDEMDYYEVKESGKLGAKEGQHDDVVVSTAGAVWLALEHMPAPKLKEVSSERKKKPVGPATFH